MSLMPSAGAGRSPRKTGRRIRVQPGLHGALAKSRKSPLGRGATSNSRRRRPASQRRRNSCTGLGRGPEQWGASDAAQDAVEFEVGLLAGEGAAAGTPAAVNAAGVEVPGFALGRGQEGEPVFGEGAEEASHVDLGRGAGVPQQSVRFRSYRQRRLDGGAGCIRHSARLVADGDKHAPQWPALFQ
jgi:hypothetical protein